MAASDDLEDILKRILCDSQSDVAHDLAHVERVWGNAKVIAEGEKVEIGKVLLAAVMLHDIVTLPKNHPDRARASTLSGRKAWKIVRDLGFTREDSDAVSHAIAAHSFSAGIAPSTDEARILQDADRLDALGAVGLARCFAVSGALGRPLWHDADPFARMRPLDDRRYGLDHFASKLLTLEVRMQTETGRKIARERTEVLRRYLADLEQELGPR